MPLEVKGLDKAIANAEKRAKRARDLRPALKVVGRSFERIHDDSFRRQMSPLGEDWDPLSVATLRQRAARAAPRKRVGEKKRRAGKLSKAQVRRRLRILLDPTATTPLVDTAVMRNSQRFELNGLRALRWSAIKYAVYHMAGDPPDLPKRNFTVFEPIGAGRFRMVPKASSSATAILGHYIVTGKLTATPPRTA